MERMKEQNPAACRWAHDIRTHMHVVLAAIGMLQSGKLNEPKQREYFAMLRKNILSAIRLTDYFVDAGGAGAEIAPEIFSADELLREGYESFLPYAQRYGVEMICDVQASLSVCCERESLERVLYNLISNAIRYTQSGGAVHICALREADEIVMMVSDTGRGIETKQCGALLGESGAGGLGLQIVDELTREIGGRVTCRSEIGIGSTFTLRLPRAQACEGALFRQKIMETLP